MKNTLLILIIFLLNIGVLSAQYTLRFDGLSMNGSGNQVTANKINLAFDNSYSFTNRQTLPESKTSISVVLENADISGFAKAHLLGTSVPRVEINMNRKMVVKLENVRILSLNERIANNKSEISMQLETQKIEFSSPQSNSFRWDLRAQRQY